MRDNDKTREQLVEELADLRQQLDRFQSNRAGTEASAGGGTPVPPHSPAGEKIFRAILESISDCVVAWDREYTYLYANRAAIEDAGAGKETIIGQNIRDTLGQNPELMRTWMSRVDRAFDTGNSFRVEDTMPVDDRLVLGESVVSPVRSDDGEILAVAVVYRDVTERRLAEEQLRVDRDHLATLVREKSKKQACMHAISELTRRDDSTLQEILRKVPDLIPPGWQYPQDTCARLIVEGKEFKTAKFEETPWKLAADIISNGRSVGTIEVCYLRQKPILDDGPFLEEERTLINDIASRLGDLIGHEHTREALDFERKQLLALFEGIEDVMYVSDPSTYELLYVNSTVRRTWGDNAIGKKCYEVLQNFSEPCSFCNNAEIFGERLNEHYVWELQNEVNKRWYRCADKAVRWADGRMVRFEIASDITAQKQIEEELRKGKETIEALLNATPDAVILLDAGGTIEEVNEAARRFLGKTRDELIGTGVFNVVSPEMAGLWGEKVQEVLSTERSVLFGDTFEDRYLENGIYPMLGPDGIKRLAVYAKDITDRKSREAALKESEERFRANFEQAAVGMAHVSPDGQWLRVNQKFCQIVGYAADELKETTFRDLTHPDDLEADLDLKRRLLDGEIDTYSLEKRYVRRDGSIVWITVTTALVRHPSGEPHYLIGAVQDITTRKQMEKDLRTSEARYRTLVESIPQMIFMKDKDFRWITVNENLAHQLGLKPEEVLGKVDSDFFPPDLSNKYREDDVRIMETGATGEFDEEYIEDGEPRIVHTVKTPVRDDTGAIIGLLGVFWDVTEQRRAEAVIREARDRYESLVRSIPDAIYSALPDGSGRTTFMSERWHEWTGYVLEDFYSNREARSRSIHPDDLQTTVAKYLETCRSGRDFVAEYRVLHKDTGDIRWVRDHGVAVTDQEGKILRIDGVATDITDLKRTQEALEKAERAEARVRLTQELEATATILNDMLGGDLDDAETEGRVLNACLAATRSTYGMIGWVNERGKFDATSFDSRTLQDCAFPDPIKWELKTGMTIRGAWGRPMLQSQSVMCNDLESHPESVEKPTGHVPIHSFLGAPFMRAGKVGGMIAVANKEGGYAEADSDTLVRLATLMTASLEHRRALLAIQEARDNLERSNRELEQFAYVASHDLQEPLRMVSSYTQLLAKRYEDKLDEKAKKFIHYAVDGAVRMQRLINDLLSFSRVTTRGGGFELIDSHEALDRAIANLGAMIQESDAQVTYDALPQVIADPTQLTQIFQNLIGNAIKFRGPNQPRIHVSAEEEDLRWVFSVRDNGIGIQPQYQEKVFVIFKRLHTRGEFPGTGIGLAICKRVAERHGGEIWLESEPEKGSTFYFTLPRNPKESTTHVR